MYNWLCKKELGSLTPKLIFYRWVVEQTTKIWLMLTLQTYSSCSGCKVYWLIDNYLLWTPFPKFCYVCIILISRMGWMWDFTPPLIIITFHLFSASTIFVSWHLTLKCVGYSQSIRRRKKIHTDLKSIPSNRGNMFQPKNIKVLCCTGNN